jgi:hypothetical protein
LKSGGTVCQINSEAGGKGIILNVLVFVVGTGPMTYTAVTSDLSHEIVKAIRANTNSETIRFAIMGAVNENNDLSLRKDYLLDRYYEGDESYWIMTELAVLGEITPLENLALAGDIDAAIDLYELTGISGPLKKFAEDGNQEAISKLYKSNKSITE